MPPKYWASSEDLSVESDKSLDSRSHLNMDHIIAARDAKKPSTTSLETSDMEKIVARGIGMNVPTSTPQEHSNLLLLSLIEDRCKTQVVDELNKTRQKEDWLDRNDEEVCRLARHKFTSIKEMMAQTEMIPKEWADKGPQDHQVYLKSFDAVLKNINATEANGEILIPEFKALKNGARELNTPNSYNHSKALVLQRAPVTAISSIKQSSIEVFGLSDYNQQYIEKAILGSGGEGSVYQAHYKLDGGVYAIKKVVISAKKLRRLQRDPNSLIENLKEVETLAKLHHPNVVRYHHCWIEFQKSSKRSTTQEKREKNSEDDFLKPNSRNENRQRSVPHGRVISDTEDVEDNSIDESESISSNHPDSSSEAQASYSEVEETSFAQGVENLHLGISQPDFSEEELAQEEPFDDIVVFGHSSNAAPEVEEEESQSLHNVIQQYNYPEEQDHDAVLYIKMTAYPTTLDAFLRHEATNKSIPGHCFHALPTIRILLTIIDGLQYIHRQNIIHQDLKPSNIFLSLLPAGEPATTAHVNISDCPDCASSTSCASSTPFYISPHIGDFGMIKELKSGQPITLHTSSSSPPTSPDSSSTPSNLSAYKPGDSFLAGTGFYKPPQIRGVKPTICPKRDSYALGAIALEMLCRFGSSSERVHVFNQIRDRSVFPEEVRGHVLGECVMGMLEKEREERWDVDAVRVFLRERERELCLAQERGGVS